MTRSAADVIREASERWPALAASLATLADDASLDATLCARAHAADVLLARLCLAGDPAALAILERTSLAPAASLLERRRFARSLVDEGLQLARLRLLTTGPQGGAPALVGYSGDGPLARFVEIVASHAVLGLKQQGERDPVELVADFVAAGKPDSAHALASREVSDLLKVAVRDAIAELSPRQRALLRFSIIEAKNYDALAKVYGVSRATVARWMSEARAVVAERVRAQLAPALGERSDDLALSLSHVDLSLSRLLGGA